MFSPCLTPFSNTSHSLLRTLLVGHRASGRTSSMASRTSSTCRRDRSSYTKSRHHHPLPRLRRKLLVVAGLLLRRRGHLRCREGLKVPPRQLWGQHAPQQLLQLTTRFKDQAQRHITFGHRQPRAGMTTVRAWINKHAPFPRQRPQQGILAVSILLLLRVVGTPGETRRVEGRVRRVHTLPYALQPETNRRRGDF